ncbi:MAG: ATPase [Anaerococcus sp.]|nr:ATPase [Anaerococcus sp.]MDD7044655.1 ATPase [Peptoniphilaceae bacterium]MDY2918102.1 ATPase [Anaerococcus sp.]
MAQNKLMGLINEMEDILDEASSVPFSRKVSVDPDDIFDLLKEMKDSLPEEIKQAQWVIDEKDRIVGEANGEAESRLKETENEINNIKEQARNKFRQLVSENEITREARNEAQRILAEANNEAAKLREQSYVYVDRLFKGSVQNFSQLAEQLEKNRQNLLNDKN